jgi:hypothetical protein
MMTYAPMNMTSGDLVLRTTHARSLLLWGKCLLWKTCIRLHKKCSWFCQENKGKEVLANYNKTTYATNMTLGWNWRKCWWFKLMRKCNHQCHCACSSEIGTCIINDAGRQAVHKKTTKIYVFGRISPND